MMKNSWSGIQLSKKFVFLKGFFNLWPLSQKMDTNFKFASEDMMFRCTSLLLIVFIVTKLIDLQDITYDDN